MPEPRFPGPVPTDALDFFRAKDLKVGFDYRDVWREEHAYSFTVAKMTRLDLLRDVQDSLAGALENGQTFREWSKTIRPELERRGWWGIQRRVDPQTGEIKKVQLGSPRRLKTIYRTNLRTARAAGQWQRIERTKDTHPYLLYQLGPSERHRAQHVAWAGLLLPIEDSFWDAHFPPQGYGCKCWVRQVSRREHDRLQRDGYADPLAPQEIDPDTGLPTGRRLKRTRPVTTEAPPTRYRAWHNKRTGEIEQVPVGVTPSFDFNPGKHRAATLTHLLNRDLVEADPPIAAAVAKLGGTKHFSRAQAEAILTNLDPAAATVEALGAAALPAVPEHLRRAITVYTDGRGEWRDVNIALRSGDPSRAIERYRDLLDSALTRVAPHRGTVTRGLNLPDTELTPFLELHQRAWRTQSAVNYPGFTSATDGPDFIGGNVVLSIQSFTGRDIRALSMKPEQREVLFRAPSRFRVLRLERADEKWYIQMEEVP